MRRLVLIVALLLAGAPALAQHAGHQTATEAKGCPEGAAPALACAATATPFMDEAGRLWLTWAQGGHVYIVNSDDPGAGFGPPVRVTRSTMDVDDNGENRPKAVARGNGVFVSFTVRGQRRFTGVVHLAVSVDGGKTFDEPRPVGDETIHSSQRFENMAIAPDGRLYVAWLDKRDLFEAEAAKEEYRGSGIWYAVFDDQGRSLGPNRKIADHTCECCSIDLAVGPDGPPLALWRHVFEPNLRDHALARFGGQDEPEIFRVSEDGWAIDGCPHHGPSISLDPDGTIHVAWFTDGTERQGIFHARSDDGGRTFSPPMAFGDGENQLSHPRVMALGDRVWLAWKENDGDLVKARVMLSEDGGRNWSPPKTVATALDTSDRPFLLGHDGKAWLSWFATAEGYRLMALN